MPDKNLRRGRSSTCNASAATDQNDAEGNTGTPERAGMESRLLGRRLPDVSHCDPARLRGYA